MEKKLVWLKIKFCLLWTIAVVIFLSAILQITYYMLIPAMTRTSPYYEEAPLYEEPLVRPFPLKEPRFNSEILPYSISYVISEEDPANKKVVLNGDVVTWTGGVPLDDYHTENASTKDLLLTFIQLRAANTSIHYDTLCEDVDALRWTYRTIDEFFLREDVLDVLTAAVRQTTQYHAKDTKPETWFNPNERLGLMLSQLKTKYPIRQTIYQLYLYATAEEPPERGLASSSSRDDGR